MAPVVVFIDTSILCNLLPVPGKCQHEDEVKQDLNARMAGGECFVLPITAVIETGNHIAQLRDGRARRDAAEKLAALLRLVCDGKAPWVLHDVDWDAAFLRDFLDGGDSGSTYVEHAVGRLGAGDLCILTERRRYQERTGIRAAVWTKDTQLAAHG